MSEEELIETLKEFEKSRVEKLKEPSRNLFYAIIKIADERDKYKIVLDKIKEYINKTTYKEVFKDDEHSIKEFWFIKDILELLEEIE